MSCHCPPSQEPQPLQVMEGRKLWEKALARKADTECCIHVCRAYWNTCMQSLLVHVHMRPYISHHKIALCIFLSLSRDMLLDDDVIYIHPCNTMQSSCCTSIHICISVSIHICMRYALARLAYTNMHRHPHPSLQTKKHMS